ncbi:hypothetical protein CY652_22065, partial [Burkholderia sp. WAC0059]
MRSRTITHPKKAFHSNGKRSFDDPRKSSGAIRSARVDGVRRRDRRRRPGRALGGDPPEAARPGKRRRDR